MAKTAKLVARNVKPSFEHDCEACQFLGSLDGHDLYFCPTHGEYSARFGNEGHEYASLGTMTPEGSPYALAAEIRKRKLPPNAYATRSVLACPTTTRQLASVLSRPGRRFVATEAGTFLRS